MIKVLSLDLQGTLSSSDFSDYFWLELLPIKYKEKYNLTLEESKTVLKNKFREYGVYNRLYYDDAYWANILEFNTLEELDKFSIRPKINSELYSLIKEIDIPVIILSTTTDLFINYELSTIDDVFYKKYSCIDYFQVGGKTSDVFNKVCEELKINNDELLHVGDSKVMDIENAKLAGVQTVFYEGDMQKTIEDIRKLLEV